MRSRELERCVIALRLGMSAQANQELVRVVDALAAGMDVKPALALELAPILGELVAAQERGDGLRVADLLQFEVAPRIDRGSPSAR